MIYTPLTNRAMLLAYRAHDGHLDHGGVPYVFHPLHLAEQMDDEISACVALLHDVVEDTDVTLEALARQFPPEVVEAVALLTHDDGEDYFDYVRRLKSNPVAKKVKLADLAHNSDESRLAGLPAQEAAALLQRLRPKYQKAREILEAAD